MRASYLLVKIFTLITNTIYAADLSTLRLFGWKLKRNPSNPFNKIDLKDLTKLKTVNATRAELNSAVDWCWKFDSSDQYPGSISSRQRHANISKTVNSRIKRCWTYNRGVRSVCFLFIPQSAAEVILIFSFCLLTLIIINCLSLQLYTCC